MSKHQWPAAGLLVVLLVLMRGTLAAPDQSPLPDAAVLAPDSPTALEITRELERRQQAIEETQSELGPYHPSLVEMYADLAAYYQEIGDLEQALAMYREAFQLTRISAGLNSEQQLPYIDKLIEGSLAASDWQQADDLNQLRYYLKNRLYQPADPRYALAVAELGDWKLRAMRENLLSENYRGIGREAEELSDIYSNSIARIQAVPQYSEMSLLPLYRGKSHADLEVARVLAETPYQFFEGTVSRYVYQTVCNNVSDGQGGVVRQCNSIQRENPRYRDSQRDSKRMMVNRSIREVEVSLQNLNDILARNPDFPGSDRERLNSEIRELETEFLRIQRNSRRSLLF
ncbi:MAG: tetratricopeptide repeat protein [Gammaproteobacteria bacterium]|nr:tetratricopeptide repeat protein [Pseudomonadales bacterium]MCP5349113.1 tetratricopeptide repeat protein [Pseudomonadales bacterium]